MQHPHAHIVLLGPSCVGKTRLLALWTGQRQHCNHAYEPTIESGVYCSAHNVSFHDTAGCDNKGPGYTHIRREAIGMSDAFVIVVRQDDTDTLDALLDEIINNHHDHVAFNSVVIVLVRESTNVDDPDTVKPKYAWLVESTFAYDDHQRSLETALMCARRSVGKLKSLHLSDKSDSITPTTSSSTSSSASSSLETMTSCPHSGDVARRRNSIARSFSAYVTPLRTHFTRERSSSPSPCIGAAEHDASVRLLTGTDTCVSATASTDVTLVPRHTSADALPRRRGSEPSGLAALRTSCPGPRRGVVRSSSSSVTSPRSATPSPRTGPASARCPVNSSRLPPTSVSDDHLFAAAPTPCPGAHAVV